VALIKEVVYLCTGKLLPIINCQKWQKSGPGAKKKTNVCDLCTRLASSLSGAILLDSWPTMVTRGETANTAKNGKMTNIQL